MVRTVSNRQLQIEASVSKELGALRVEVKQSVKKLTIFFLFGVLFVGLLLSASASADDRQMNNVYQHMFVKTENPHKLDGIVVIFPEFWGPTGFISDAANRLSRMGYHVLAIDFYGKGHIATTPQEASHLFMQLQSNPEQLFKSVNKKLRELGYVDPQKIYGISFSAGNILMLGYQEQYEASFSKMISVYGRIPSPNKLLQGDYLIINGEDDQSVTENDLKNIVKKFSTPPKVLQLENSMHMFLNPAADEVAERFGRPVQFNAEATVIAWRAIESFFSSGNDIFGMEKK